MEFVETPHFTALLRDHLSEDTYRELQASVIEKRDNVPILQGAGGARKLVRGWQQGEALRPQGDLLLGVPQVPDLFSHHVGKRGQEGLSRGRRPSFALAKELDDNGQGDI